MTLANSFLLPLVLTIVTEVIVAYVFGFRKKTEIITIIFINLLTNPILNYLLLVNGYFSFFEINPTLILFLELAVVLAEWRLLIFALQKSPKQLLILSLAMNLCSYIIGALLLR